ncbi:NADPH-dependent FMN reductase [Actinomadura sp. HBU206391]|uniref:NADPH-dependent FMN reductase n=1 Tax=Actinomadura sp. HBU206391 TaxID=2731692 RepID=UPI00164F0411|nr:NAD(P)H-dependent oxidoreductase [Actinomadura sp. HBU206391]MBC6456436.1 NAD(P)H-dependent oxidoreductase [Actinomadura sp. HBU206391]
MSEEPFQLAVLIGSVRKGRFGPTVADWFVGRAEQRGDMKVDVVDLLHTEIPSADFTSRVGATDAFVVVTPEYNHGYPGELKLAIDSVNREWHAKPVGFVSYGGLSGGLRSVEQLRAVFAELHTVTVRETVSFHNSRVNFDEKGDPRDPEAVNAAAGVLLDQLAWWAHALREARAARPYGT